MIVIISKCKQYVLNKYTFWTHVIGRKNSTKAINIPEEKFAQVSPHRNIEFYKDLYYLLNSEDYLHYLYYTQTRICTNFTLFLHFNKQHKNRNESKQRRDLVKSVINKHINDLKPLYTAIVITEKMRRHHITGERSNLIWVQGMKEILALFFNIIALKVEQLMIAEKFHISPEKWDELMISKTDSYRLYLWFKNMVIPLAFDIQSIESQLKAITRVLYRNLRLSPILRYNHLPNYLDTWYEEFSVLFKTNPHFYLYPSIQQAYSLSMLNLMLKRDLLPKDTHIVDQKITSIKQDGKDTEIMVIIRPFENFTYSEFQKWITSRNITTKLAHLIQNVSKYESVWKKESSHKILGHNLIKNIQSSSPGEHFVKYEKAFEKLYLHSNSLTKVHLNTFRECVLYNISIETYHSLKQDDTCRVCGFSLSELNLFRNKPWTEYHEKYIQTLHKCYIMRIYNSMKVVETFYNKIPQKLESEFQARKYLSGFYSNLITTRFITNKNILYYNPEDFAETQKPNYYHIGVRLHLKNYPHKEVRECFQLLSYFSYLFEWNAFLYQKQKNFIPEQEHLILLTTYSEVFTESSDWKQTFNTYGHPKKILDKIISCQVYDFTSSEDEVSEKFDEAFGSYTFNGYLANTIKKVILLKQRLEAKCVRLETIL